MAKRKEENISRLLTTLLKPWHEAVENPEGAQQQVLHRLLEDYCQTEYGRQYGVHNIETVGDYRKAFPIVSYERIKPWIDRVMEGEVNALLNEEPIGWAITRGTTKGESKFIPMTPTDLRQRISAGRAMMNYVASADRFDLFNGVNLNLNFPSIIGSIQVAGKEVDYGYSSGIYTKHVSRFTPIRSVPSQEEIDKLGGGKKISDWAKRFELALTLCRDQNVTLVGGVCQTAIQFARYMHREHRQYPRDLWQVKVMTLGSTPGINTRFRTTLKAMYGPVVIREIYGATEGMFGQQMDHNRAWVPNYDQFFFEVETRRGIKMLHEMKPMELGSLVVSTPILPRYRIGDVILAFQPPYFRCIGRQHRWTLLKYAWDEIMSLSFNQL